MLPMAHTARLDLLNSLTLCGARTALIAVLGLDLILNITFKSDTINSQLQLPFLSRRGSRTVSRVVTAASSG